MGVSERALVIGGAGADDLVTRCLLRLEASFDLPPTVAIRHGCGLKRSVAGLSAADRILAFVAAPPGVASDFLGLLREGEAAAAVGTAVAVSPTAVVGIAPGRESAVDDAVHLAVTTLIDWGHAIARRLDQ